MASLTLPAPRRTGYPSAQGFPRSRLAVDAAGNLYIGDRIVTPDGVVHRNPGGAGPAASDSSGNFYFIRGGAVVRVSATGTQTTLFQGGGGGCGGSRGYTNYYCWESDVLDVAVDSGGTVYVATATYATVAYSGLGVPLGAVFKLAADGSPARVGGYVMWPSGLATDRPGNLYIADQYSQRVYKLDPKGQMTAFAGTGAAGFSGDGPATASTLNWPSALAVDAAGNLYIADFWNERLRQVAPDGTMRTIAGNGQWRFSGDGGPATRAVLFEPRAVTFDNAGNFYIADAANNRVRKVTPDGTITTVAGNGGYASNGDGGPATRASLEFMARPSASVESSSWRPGLAVAPDGTIYVSTSRRIRRIAPDGTITTVADGTNGPLYVSTCTPDGTPALEAVFEVEDVAASPAGKLHFVDLTCQSVRTIDAAGKLRTVARVWWPRRLRFDGLGNLYIAGDYCVYKLGLDGLLRPIAGYPPVENGYGFVRVGPAIQLPVYDLAVDVAGNIFTAGHGPSGPQIDWLSPTGVLRTIPVDLSYYAPFGIAPDNKGSLYLPEVLKDLVLRMKISQSPGLPEPELSVNLSPGFYSAEVNLAEDARQGYWSMEVSPAAGFAGGFIAGGGVQASTLPPAWVAFSLSRPGSIRVQLVAYPIGEDAPARPPLLVRLLGSSRDQIGTDQRGAGSLQFERNLDAGFYIIEVRGESYTPRATFQLGLTAETIAGPTYAGAFIMPGISGFAAFYLPQQQNVRIKASGTPANGPEGAGRLELRVQDVDRHLIRTAP